MRHCILQEKEWGIREECGVIGIISNTKKDIAREVYFGLFALQHRGQESAGIAVYYEQEGVVYYKNNGLVNYVFGEEELSLLPESNVAIGHVRYASSGASNVANAQPIVFYGKYGRMAVAYNGNLINADALKSKMIRKGHIFQSSVDAEVIATLINESKSEKIEESIYAASRQFVGSFAFVVLAGDKLVAVRDTYGLKPLIMGEKEGEIIFASESSALDALDARIIRDVEPGEIIIVNSNGKIKSQKFGDATPRPCIFEYVYLARSDSVIDEVSVYKARYECGKRLAEICKIDADIVAGVPDSALVAAKGYADFSGIPYVDALSKNRYIGRIFIQPSQAQRESSVKIKLTAFRNNIKGKKLIIIDDSIVRGTTSKKIIKLLRQNGATEVHMIVASPIIKHPCFFGVDMKTREQLIGSYINEEEICRKIGADSLHYIKLESLISSCGGGGFCTGCFDANYAMDIGAIGEDNGY